MVDFIIGCAVVDLFDQDFRQHGISSADIILFHMYMNFTSYCNWVTRASSEEATYARGLVILNYISIENFAYL